MRGIVMGLMVAALALGGCSSSPKDATVKEKQFRFQVHVDSDGILYSPNGEPLTGGPLGTSTCIAAMTRWFSLVDSNHDGVIDPTELAADARTMFNRMDRDHDGAVYPSELLSYREPFRVGAKRIHVEAVQETSTDEKKKKVEPDYSDPVMSADTNLDFKVTQDEMIAQAQDLFKTIDRDHNGKLDKAEVLATCPVQTE